MELMARKYRRLIRRAQASPTYWAQAAMRNFVLDISRRMHRQRLTRADLAKKLGKSRPYVTKIMRGDVNFTLDSMTRIAMAVGGKLRIKVVRR